MKNYIKYLITKPSKIVWLIFVWGFASIFTTLLIIERDIIISDNTPTIYLFLWIFIIATFSIANYQPYKEYKDGL